MFPLLFDYGLLGKTMVLYDSRMMEYTEAQNHLLLHDAAVSLLMIWYHAYSMGRQWIWKTAVCKCET